jgi:hypothetical protein
VESDLVEEIATTGGAEAGTPGADTPMRQIFESWTLRTYTRRAASRDCRRETTGMMPYPKSESVDAMFSLRSEEKDKQ